MANKNNFDLKQYLDFHCMRYDLAMDICKVHRTTFLRWLSGETIPPHAALELIRLHVTGEPPSVSTEWHNWRFISGMGLQSCASRRIFTPSDILMIPAYESMQRELQNIKQNFALQSKLF